METPSSIPRSAVSSQATAHTSGKKQQEVPEIKSMSSEPRTTTCMGRRPERPVLLDITNDSPIVGLAAGSLKTPSSSVGKSRARAAGRGGGGTPGSGEALLRGQVKTLLQKVDEDAELVRVPSDGAAPFQALLGHLRSPAGLLAPTPANTPQIVSLPGDMDGPVAEIIPPAQKDDDDSKLSTLVAAVLKEQETPDLLRQCVINRALQFDSAAEDSDQFSGSAVTYQGSDLSGCTKKAMDDDDCSSAWSTQTNPSWREDEEEAEEEEEVVDCGGADDGYFEGEEEEEEEAEAEGLDALCEGMRMMSVVGLPDFAGKHTRFSYNSDDEMVGEEVGGGGSISPGVLRLRGMPVPNGKHLRFQEEEVDDEEV